MTRLESHDQREENPLSPRAIAERFAVDEEVKAVLRETRAMYQQKLADILAEQGVPRVWVEGE